MVEKYIIIPIRKIVHKWNAVVSLAQEVLDWRNGATRQMSKCERCFVHFERNASSVCCYTKTEFSGMATEKLFSEAGMYYSSLSAFRWKHISS